MLQDAQAMHGDVAQNQRELVLKTFREGKFKCLVSTDVAARCDRPCSAILIIIITAHGLLSIISQCVSPTACAADWIFPRWIW